MVQKTLEKSITYEKFKEIIQEDQKAHLINGRIFMETPASYKHEYIFGKLFSILRIYVVSRDLGIVLGSRTLVRIDKYNAFEPDLLFISKERKNIIKEYEIVGAPDLVIEIISKSSRREDRVEKFLGYEKIGVKEYWLIDSEKDIAEFYALKGKKFEEIEVKDGVFKSTVIKDFWIKIQWLFDDKVKETDIINKILPSKEGLPTRGF